MTNYYQNTAFWLARQRHFFPRLFGYNLIQASFRMVFNNPQGPAETKPEQVLQLGALMRQGLARYVNDTMTIDYVRATLAASGLTDLLPEQPWKPGQTHPSNFTGIIVDAAVGGAAIELAAEIIKAQNEKLPIERAEAAARKGMLTGMRTLKTFLLETAKKTELFAARLAADVTS
jgi:hypothetical protein